MAGVQHVQQGALDLETGGAGVLFDQVGLQDVLQGGEILKAQLLGQGVARHGVLGGADFLDLHLEFGGLPLQAVHAVVVREADLDHRVGAGLGAHQLVLEARNELAGAQHQFEIGRGAALEGLAVDAAQEVDQQLVAGFGLGGLGLLGLIDAVLLGQAVQSLRDFLFRRLIDRAGQGQLRDADGFEVGHHLDGQFIGQVRLAVDHLVHVGLGLQVGLRGDAQIVVGQHLLAGFRQGLLDHFGHQRLAVDAANMGGRDLAGTEPAQVHLRRQFGDPGFEFLSQILLGHPNAIDAAQAFARLFNDLEGHLVSSSQESKGAAGPAGRQRSALMSFPLQRANPPLPKVISVAGKAGADERTRTSTPLGAGT